LNYMFRGRNGAEKKSRRGRVKEGSVDRILLIPWEGPYKINCAPQARNK